MLAFANALKSFLVDSFFPSKLAIVVTILSNCLWNYKRGTAIPNQVLLRQDVAREIFTPEENHGIGQNFQSVLDVSPILKNGLSPAVNRETEEIGQNRI